MKLEVILAKLAADASKPMPAPQPLGIKQPAAPAAAAPPKLGPQPVAPLKPPALKPVAPTAPPKPALPAPPPAPQPPVGSAAPQQSALGGMFSGLHGIASGSSPQDIGKFMGAMGPLTKGVAAVGGLPAVAGIMDHVRGGDSLSTLLRGPGT